MKAQTGYTGGAAKVCDDYAIIVGGVTYDDWFLPSKDELYKLYLNKDKIGGFTDAWYWSSSENWLTNLASGAGDQDFTSGIQGWDYPKANLDRVRAVRYF